MPGWRRGRFWHAVYAEPAKQGYQSPQVSLAERGERPGVLNEAAPETRPQSFAVRGERQCLDPAVARVGLPLHGATPFEAVGHGAEVRRVVVQFGGQSPHRGRLARTEREQRPHLDRRQADRRRVRRPLLTQAVGEHQEREIRVAGEALSFGTGWRQVSGHVHESQL